MDQDSGTIQNSEKEGKGAISPDVTGRELIEELILENKTINALIKGLLEDIETFKKANDGEGSASDVVRFTMQLNILKDKERRNLASINELIKKNNPHQQTQE